MTFSELLHYLRLGGVTLAAILVCSVIALAVAVERAAALWKVTEGARSLNDSIARCLLRGDVAGARTAAERSDSIAADIFLAGFGRLDRPGAAGLETAVERERAQVGLKLKAHLWILGTIGATAPFIGLFGTVAGIMRSFKDLGLDVESGGAGGTSAVMMGISEALVATAAGILVAVQAVIFYNFFQSRLGRIQVELKLITEEFLELVRERPALSASPTPATTGVPASEGSA